LHLGTDSLDVIVCHKPLCLRKKADILDFVHFLLDVTDDSRDRLFFHDIAVDVVEVKQYALGRVLEHMEVTQVGEH
jgi:hypothetical protein